MSAVAAPPPNEETRAIAEDFLDAMAAPPQEGRTAPPEIEQALEVYEDNLVSRSAVEPHEEDAQVIANLRSALLSAVVRALAGERARALEDGVRALASMRMGPAFQGGVKAAWRHFKALGAEKLRALAGAPPETEADEGKER